MLGECPSAAAADCGGGEYGGRYLHIDVCGEQEGVAWHKHVTDHRTLWDLVEGYPGSFMRSAIGPYGPQAPWLLDGLAEMEVAEDPEGLLPETRGYAAARCGWNL